MTTPLDLFRLRRLDLAGPAAAAVTAVKAVTAVATPPGASEASSNSAGTDLSSANSSTATAPASAANTAASTAATGIKQKSKRNKKASDIDSAELNTALDSVLEAYAASERPQGATATRLAVPVTDRTGGGGTELEEEVVMPERTSLRGRKGWGDRSVNKLLAAIDEKRRVSFDRWVIMF